MGGFRVGLAMSLGYWGAGREAGGEGGYIWGAWRSLGVGATLVGAPNMGRNEMIIYGDCGAFFSLALCAFPGQG